jgi:hypothetical protein
VCLNLSALIGQAHDPFSLLKLNAAQLERSKYPQASATRDAPEVLGFAAPRLLFAILPALAGGTSAVFLLLQVVLSDAHA